ncbi:nitroreductase, putative [Ichthyophthirius multifiliis]|uniref:Nitroreductase, putative n=1 Tax=Ichthyophthirius multifiliis TaxID=5932 RepID=G0QS28_ICHMU|nr:nitroreductase, putative [Ichthyophthirius multifiliis]EGR31970.1 nitroreductase, putative [Ichthyophthirius multifiliis]|eukprot:XP_004035456.1 nitroreductase, putative [Ichthyophthirius multifiliis]
MKKRRSIMPKDYLSDLVEDQEINHILECANMAPTHGKTEPWRFVVYKRANLSNLFNFVISWYEKNWQQIYKNEEERDKGIQSIQNKFDELAKASHFIGIGMKRQTKKDKLMPEWEEIAAVSTSVQNIYLQCAAKGLGGYWSSMNFAKECRDSEEFLNFMGLEDKGDRFLGNFVIAKTNKYDQYQRIPGKYQDKVQFR